MLLRIVLRRSPAAHGGRKHDSREIPMTTTNKNQRKFGPVEWSPSVLEKIYNCPTENNDSVVTLDTVKGWVTYFESHEQGFRDSHKGILAQIEGTL
jgi:hypothetical protein